MPTGTYDIDIKLFANGAMITRTETAFEIVKVGFEQFVADAARRNGLLYGLVTALMALGDRLAGVGDLPEGLDFHHCGRSDPAPHAPPPHASVTMKELSSSRSHKRQPLV